MLTALDARVQVQGPEKKREIPLSNFFLGFYTTALEPNEILTEVVIPALPSSARAAYHKYTSISAEGRPCVAVGAVADFDQVYAKICGSQWVRQLRRLSDREAGDGARST
jgi:carbon-monoxide dehydrogenase medium subunit